MTGERKTTIIKGCSIEQSFFVSSCRLAVFETDWQAIGGRLSGAFPDNRCGLTNVQCRETFTNLNQDQNHTCFNVPKDPISQLYFASVGVLGIYILYGIMVKNNLLPK